MFWKEVMPCTIEQISETKYSPSSPSSISFSFSEAVDEAKPKESARQDEGKEDPEADQEHA